MRSIHSVEWRESEILKQRVRDGGADVIAGGHDGREESGGGGFVRDAMEREGEGGGDEGIEEGFGESFGGKNGS